VKVKEVPFSWIPRWGHRLDVEPFVGGAVEARLVLESLKGEAQPLHAVTAGGMSGIVHAGRIKRQWVEDPRYGTPFLSSTDTLRADLTHCSLISNKAVRSNPLLIIRKGWTLITRAGTVGRMAYSRPDMDGMACTEDVLRIVPDSAVIPSGYLFAFLNSKYGLPMVTSGTYGAIIQHIEPEHIADLPVPRFDDAFESHVHSLVEEAASARVDAAAEIAQVTLELAELTGLRNFGGNESPFHYSSYSVMASQLNASGRMEAAYHDAVVHEIERRIALMPSRRICDVADVIKPGMFRRIKVDSADQGYGFITGSELFSIAPKPLYFVSPRTPNIEDCVLKPFWVLIQAFGQSGGLIGRCILTTPSQRDFAATDLQIQLRFPEERDAGYAFSFLSTSAGYRLLARLPIGGSIPHIHPDDVRNLTIPWPDEELRRSIGQRAIDAWLLRERAVRLEDLAKSEVEARIEEAA
jgi:type I restriction enzyme S subunit